MKRIREVATSLLLVLVAVFAFMLSRAGLVETKFASHNPITDKKILEKVQSGQVDENERRRYLSKGSDILAETLYIPPPPVLKFLSLSYGTTLADLVLLRAHAYFLSHFFADRRYEWLDNYFNAMVALDPHNPKFYLWASQVVKFGQLIDDETILRSNRFLEQGLEIFPDDFKLHMDIGFNLYFEYKGKDENDKARAKIKAREHFAKAASLPGAPIDPNFVVAIFQSAYEESLGLAYALQKYFDATKEQREEMLRRLKIMSDVLADQVEKEETAYKKMPYVPLSLFSILFSGTKTDVTKQLLDAMRSKDGQ